MANEQNLKPGEYKLTQEEQKKGGIASGKARKERASLRKSLESILNSDIRITKGSIYEHYKELGIDIKDKSLVELANLGLLFGAVNGNAVNYKTIMETNNEIEPTENNTPTIKVEIVDNNNLESKMYEEDRHNENDK